MKFLTKQEKYIVIFLIAGAVCGASYSYYKKSHPPIDISFKKVLQQDASLQRELDLLLEEAKSININQASFEEMMMLNGVGPALAHRIIEYRRQNGPFRSKEDILNIPGIGPKKFEAVKERIILE
ncbi:MAG: helix-hairpin-helix domain-containing protein [Candidatus Omnitrophica bacterium]|nr:helix-hairpin-helix domain-containing protein [Candidatus Omnitrophota bacterium]